MVSCLCGADVEHCVHCFLQSFFDNRPVRLGGEGGATFSSSTTMVWLWLVLALVWSTGSGAQVGTTLKGVALVRHGDSQTEPYFVIGPLPVLQTSFTKDLNTGFRLYTETSTYSTGITNTGQSLRVAIDLLSYTESSLSVAPSELGPYTCDFSGSVPSSASDHLDSDTTTCGINFLQSPHFVYVRIDGIFPFTTTADVHLVYEGRDCDDLPFGGSGTNTPTNPINYGDCPNSGLPTSTRRACVANGALPYNTPISSCTDVCLTSMLCLRLLP